MNKRLGIANKEFQSLENAVHVKEGGRYDVINQHVIGRLIPSYPGYLDQYLSGSAEMHLHIGWLDKRPIGMANSIEIRMKNERDYCIIFEKLSTDAQPLVICNRFSETTYSKTKNTFLPATTNGNKLTVLVCVFEAVENSERIIWRKPKNHRLIRLQRYDECFSSRMKPFGGGLKVIPQLGIIDHELSVLTLGEDVLIQDWETRVLPMLFGNTGNNDVIKCTSQVMYEITEHNSNHGIRLLSDMEASPDFILAVRQPNTSKTVRIAACVPHGFLIDVYHVLLSPLELEPPVVHDMLYSNYGRQENEDTKNPERFRDTNPETQGRVRRTRKGGKANQTTSSQPPPEEVTSQTAPSHRRGDYTAKHIHSGSLEDV